MANTDYSLQPRIEVHLCVPDDQLRHLPRRRRAPEYLPPNAPLPRAGEVVYLSSSSAWGVALVVHEWRSPGELVIKVWLDYVGASHAARAAGFGVTQ
jgi:hypothetical protein